MDMPLLPFLLQFPIRAHGTLFASSSDGKLHRQNRNSHDGKEQQVKQHENAASVVSYHVREFPYISDADGTACRKQKKAKARLECLSFHFFYFLPFFFVQNSDFRTAPFCRSVRFVFLFCTMLSIILFLSEKDKQLLRACLKNFFKHALRKEIFLFFIHTAQSLSAAVS